jgi:hypothetical protein
MVKTPLTLHLAAPPHGSLTPAEAPLIDAEKLFRQLRPPLIMTRRPQAILEEAGIGAGRADHLR